jgi:hypothetical protein
MWLHLPTFSDLHTTTIVLLLDLYLPSYAATANDLGGCGTVWQVSDLCRGLPAFSSHPLDLSNNFLVLPIRARVAPEGILISFLWLVDLKLENAIIRASSASVWASSDTPASFIVERSLTRWGVWHFWLSTLRRVSSTSYGALWSVLVSDLQLLEAIIEIRTLGVL